MFRTISISFAILLVAGCLGGAADEGAPDEGAPEADAAPAFLRYADCAEHLGVFPASRDAVTLPEGFEPAPFVGDMPGVAVVGWSCGAARNGADAAEGEFRETFAGFTVTPPEALRAENATFHMLFLGLTTGSPVGAAAYRAWGIPFEEGDTAFAWTGTPAGGTGTLEGTAGPLDVDLRVNVGGPNAGEAAGLARFFVAEEGVVTAAYDIMWVPAGGFQGEATTSAPLPGVRAGTPGLGFRYVAEGDRYLMAPVALPGAT